MKNNISFEIEGKYALFSDPLTRVGGEKFSYQIPTYEAIKGILESIYWKPTIVWVIDKVRVMNPIKTEAKGIRTLSYTKEKGSRTGLSYYTYLKDVKYQVEAHFEWNLSRPDLIQDRIEGKHLEIALRKLEEGGKRDAFLGTRECQAYVRPVRFGSGKGYYDNAGTLPFGLMYHGIVYPNNTQSNKMVVNFFDAKMTNGVITYPRPSECTSSKVINKGAK